MTISLKAFNKILSDDVIFEKNPHIALGVSGGPDSIALAFLLNKWIKKNKGKLTCLIVDHKIRIDSYEESFLTKKILNKLSINSKILRVSEKNIGQGKMSQARINRFEKLINYCRKNSLLHLFLAHHYDDIVETVFINLSRGTGISGLTGIKKMENNIIRPLLIFDKDDIIDFSKKNKINYREDSSNIDEKYVRNKIRHSIIPEFEKINSNFKKSFSSTLDYLNSVKHIYENFIQKEIQNYVDYKDGVTRINLGKLKKSIEPKSVLHEIIRHYNFSDIDSVFDSIDSDSGREFFSKTHYLVKDREYYLITKKINFVSIKIHESTDAVKSPIFIRFKLIDPSGQNKIKNNALLDYSKLSFPLTLRSYKKGDWFIPSGMTGKKKLSDFFIDNKFSMIDKKKCLVLCSQEDIVWVVGRRVDERYKLVGTQEKAYICRTK